MVNTANDSMVAAGLGGQVSVLALEPNMSKDKAVRLAVYLVAMTMTSDEEFLEVLRAVEEA